MSTTKTSFYYYNNEYALKVATAKITVAAQWLRAHGCTFSTFTNYTTKLTKFYIKSAPKNVVEALTLKYGFFNAKPQAAQAAAPKSISVVTRTMGKSEITREEWVSRFRSDSKAVAQPKARKIRNADELPLNADVLKPIPVVVPQLAVETNLYNKGTAVNGQVVVTGIYTCQTVQADSDDFVCAVPIRRTQTNSDMTGGVEHQTSNVGGTPINLMPGQATAEDLMATTLTKLYKFASKNNIKGRSSLKGEKNKAALVAKLVGLVKKSELK